MDARITNEGELVFRAMLANGYTEEQWRLTCEVLFLTLHTVADSVAVGPDQGTEITDVEPYGNTEDGFLYWAFVHGPNGEKFRAEIIVKWAAE